MSSTSFTPPRSRSEARQLAARQAHALREWDASALRSAGFSPAGNDEVVLRLADDPREYRAEQRAMSAQIGTGGSYLVAETFLSSIEGALLYASAVRDNATIIRTEQGGKCAFPTVDDTGVSGFELSENALPSTNPDDITTVGQIALFARKWSSGWIVCPFELTNDAPEAFAGWLGDILGRRVSRAQNTSFTAKILTSAVKGAQAGSPTAIAPADLNALLYSVDAGYRDRPGCGWMLHSTVAQTIRNIMDNTGRPVFRPRESPDSKDMLLGYPILGFNRDFSSTIASGNISIAFGDWSKVVIRDVQEGRLRRLGERYAELDQEGFAFLLRSDVALADAGTHPIKYLLH